VKLIRELFVLNQVAILCLTSLILAVLTPSTPLLAGEKLTIYSGRAERLIKPVLDEFTSKTGIQVDLLSSGTTELVNRLKAEGDRTAADLFLTNDAGSLEQARTAGVLRPLNMREVDRAVPPQFRAPDNAWIGLSGRFWIIVYN
jgi:iron(III) transport system substrate-binding protein